ncbi:MAG: thioredoxin domain-containing protein [Acidobacteriota bacterium]
MKFTLTLIFCCTASLCIQAQKSGDIFATVNGRNFTASDLSPDTQDLLAKQATVIANAREQLLNRMIGDYLVEQEAKAKSVTPESLTGAAKAKATAPTEVQINAVYEANKAAFVDKPQSEVRKQIVEFLRRDPEEAALNEYIETLSAKYKIIKGKDINSPMLKPQDMIFSVGARPFTAKEFEDKFKLVLYDVQADIIDQVKAETENAIYLALVAEEAKAQNVDSGTLIGTEITNKMRDFSDEERIALEDEFQNKLYKKYNARILIKYPPPIVQNISVDDDPSRGPVNAPVTVVMFSDFQCPACSATHPVLQKVLAEYGDKIHFVVRDFPLTTLHDHAFRAALAANAANAQGKFFEYADILYKNQSALDDASLSKYASSLGLNVKRFELDLSSENTAAEVRKDIADGKAYGITGTPSIFINGVKVRHLSAAGFREAIDAALGKK